MVVAIVQARMGSTRLPGKVLMRIKGKTLLELFLARVKACIRIDRIVVATPANAENDPIERHVRDLGMDCYRFSGDENDLLDRYYQCAKEYKADIIYRATPDDPFVDPEVIDRAVSLIHTENADFVTNHFQPTFPEGLDVEVYTFHALEKTWKLATMLSEREHVYPFIQNNQDLFRIVHFEQCNDFSHLRWTIDYECDFRMTERIYDHLYGMKPIFLQRDILTLLESHPDIVLLNQHIKRKEGLERTKTQDRTIWKSDKR